MGYSPHTSTAKSMHILTIIRVESSIVVALSLLRLESSFACRLLNGVCSHGIEFIIRFCRHHTHIHTRCGLSVNVITAKLLSLWRYV